MMVAGLNAKLTVHNLHSQVPKIAYPTETWHLEIAKFGSRPVIIAPADDGRAVQWPH